MANKKESRRTAPPNQDPRPAPAKSAAPVPRERPAQARSAAPAPGVKQISREEIARRAYERYEKRGRQPGREIEDWLHAERELKGS